MASRAREEGKVACCPWASNLRDQMCLSLIVWLYRIFACTVTVLFTKRMRPGVSES